MTLPPIRAGGRPVRAYAGTGPIGMRSLVKNNSMGTSWLSSVLTNRAP